LGQLESVKSQMALELMAAAREKKELKRQLDLVTSSRDQIKKQAIVVATNSKQLRGICDNMKKSNLQLTNEMLKNVQDSRKSIMDTITAQGSLLAETMKKYKKELSARRKYFNLVQELRGNIRVFCRTRPFLKSDEEKNTTNACTFPEENVIFVETLKNDKPTKTEYEFDRVFSGNATQVEIFKDTKPLIQSVMDGYNVCIFAYGQTGSGKTFTMEGVEDNRGVNFRALSELFRIKRQRKDYVYKISVSMKEIYNEKIRDLLAEKESEEELKILTGDRGMYVKGLTSIPVETEEDVLTMMKRGNSNRSVGKTNMNEHSSRSHSLLSVEVEGENTIAGIKYFGKLHLIDLAGSERLSKTMATGERLKEAQAINKSLSALGNVIESLQKKSTHVPYRNSKLTYLLQDSLGGHAKTLMFINVSPTSYDGEETNCSLTFATRVRKVELGTASKNIIGKGEEGGEEIVEEEKKSTTPAATTAATAPAGGVKKAITPAPTTSPAKRPTTPAPTTATAKTPTATAKTPTAAAKSPTKPTTPRVNKK